MTFNDWVRESAHRYRTLPLTTATRRSARAFVRGGFRHLGRHMGYPIWARDDWDVLVVLDACRTDLMREVINEYPELPDADDVETFWSNASCSIDWINRNFNGYPEHAERAGYVTANPFADHDWPDAKNANLGDSDVGYFAPLYRTDWQDVKPGIATVPPEAVTDRTIATWRDRDGLGIDRLVAHYMQPHEPYITRPEWGAGDHKLLENLIDPSKEAGSSIWPKLREGEIVMDEFWAVYKDNLRWVLDDVTERLLPNVEGRVVLTADHGNALGEWGEWHHPPGAIGPSVRRVPWVAVEATDTKRIQPDRGFGSEEPEEQSVEKQLAALGYVEAESV